MLVLLLALLLTLLLLALLQAASAPSGLDRLDSSTSRHLTCLASKSSNYSEAAEDQSPAAAVRAAAGHKAGEMLAAAMSRPRVTSPQNILSAVKSVAWQVGLPAAGGAKLAGSSCCWRPTCMAH